MVLVSEEKVIPPYEEGRIGLSWSWKETGLCKGSLYLEFCSLCISPHPQIKPSSLQSSGERSEIWHSCQADGKGEHSAPHFLWTPRGTICSKLGQGGLKQREAHGHHNATAGEHFVVRLQNGEQSCPFSLVSLFSHFVVSISNNNS